jgi:hypothetical protein
MSPGRAPAVVAAVAAVLSLGACGTQTSAPGVADDPTSTPSSSATDEPTPSPTATPSTTASTADTPDPVDPGVLTIRGVPRGAPPRIPYLAHAGDTWALVRPDGTTESLDREYGEFATMGDGLVATTYSATGTQVVLLDGQLQEVHAYDVPEGGLVATPDGAIVGWLGADGRPHVVEHGGDQEWDLPEVTGGSSLAALVSDGTTCKEGVEGVGCAAYVNSPDGTRAWISISHGIVDTVPGVVAVGDVATGDAGMVAMTSVSDEGSCWGRFQDFRRKPVWETCDYTLFDFSPAGTGILAGPAYLDGFGQGLAAVLDLDGQVRAEWHSRDQAALLHTVWEDDDHVLALVFQDDQWAVLRLGVADGSVELAVPPVPDRGGASPFVLPTR